MAPRPHALAFWVLVFCCHLLDPIVAMRPFGSEGPNFTIHLSEKRAICELHYKVQIQAPAANPVTLYAMLGLDPFAAPFYPPHEAGAPPMASYENMQRGLLDAVAAHLRLFRLHRPITEMLILPGQRVWLTGSSSGVRYAQPDTQDERGPAATRRDAPGAWVLRAEVASVLLDDNLRAIYSRVFLPALVSTEPHVGWLKWFDWRSKQTNAELERVRMLKALHSICRITGTHFNMFY